MKNINNEINNKVDIDFDKRPLQINVFVPNDKTFINYKTGNIRYILVLYTDFIKEHIKSEFIIKITNKLNTNEHITFMGLYERKYKNIKGAVYAFDRYYGYRLTDRRLIKKDIKDMFRKENNHDKQIAMFRLQRILF